MPDPFSSNSNVDAPALGGLNITPADTPLATPVRALRVVTGGVVKVTGYDGSVWLANFLDGETRPLRVRQVWATGTTASGIEGMI